MRLYHHPFSPFARKIRIILREAEILDHVREIEINPFNEEDELRTLNPLAKVPVFVTDASTPIFDSRVIVSELAKSFESVRELTKVDATSEQQTLIALADGMSDIINHIRSDETRFGGVQDDAFGKRLKRGCGWAVQALNKNLPPIDVQIREPAISIACSFSYLRFRGYAPEVIRETQSLTEWLDEIEARPSFVDTRPS